MIIRLLRTLFSVPDFGNEQDNQRAALINRFDLALAILLAISMVIYTITGFTAQTMLILAVLFLIAVTSLVLLRLRQLLLSGIVVLLAGWALIGTQAYFAEGVRDVIIVAYIAVAFLATLFLGWRGTAITVAASIASIWFIAIAESQGRIIPIPQTPAAYARDFTLIFIIIASLVFFVTRNLHLTLERSRQTALALEESNTTLKTLRHSLEAQIWERTTELAQASDRFEIRAKKYRSIALVSQSAASIENLPGLLEGLALAIHKEFGYYHIGIYLIDESGQEATLMAANSPVGQVLMLRGHKIPVGAENAVGEASATRRTRIGSGDADLPDSRSQIALPLSVGNTLLGVLDVHSRESDAFSETDIEILNTLASQISASIINVRLLEQARAELQETRLSYQEYLRQEWTRFAKTLNIAGYRYDQESIEPITDAKEYTQAPGGLVVPVVLRGETLGEIVIETPSQQWNDDDYILIRAAAERAALGLENARLIDSTRQRARLERTIAEISARVGASANVDEIMRTTIEELGKVLPAQEVFIRIKDDQEKQ